MTVHGATLGRIATVAVLPTLVGVVVKSIRLLLMMIGVTGPLSRWKVLKSRSSTITFPDTERMPDALTCLASLSMPARGFSGARTRTQDDGGADQAGHRAWTVG